MVDTGRSEGHPTVIRRVAQLAQERRPDDDVLEEFVLEYYGELPEFDVDDRREDDLYAAALTHLAFGRHRKPGTTLIQVVSPDWDRDGWHSERTLVMIVTDDAPFLVDTVRLVLERHGISTHLLVHPMLRVKRGPDGTLAAIAAADDRKYRDLVEAWTLVEVDRLDDDLSERLHADLETAVASVHSVVADFAPMRSRIERFLDRDPLLAWLLDGNFVFLGAATYRLGPDGPVLVEDSVLGHTSTFRSIDPAIDPNGLPVSFSRSTRTSTIHRSSRYTVLTILDEREGERYAERFVGLLASTAYRHSVLAIPSVGDRARAVLGLAVHGAETHTGRTMRNVLETLPRDLVFELDGHQLAELVVDVVGLQERQIVRVFDVPEPVGELSTVMVYLPKQRFSAQLPERVAAYVGERYGDEPRDLESFLGTSNLARITFTLQRPDRPLDLDELSDEIDELTTAWIDRVRTIAVHRLGETRATRLLARIGDASPDSYRSAVDPNTAVGDIERLCSLIESDATTMTALIREVDADQSVWRMRVYRQGDPLALSDLLPLLGHLGLTALDEHPYRFVIGGEECFLYDVGVCMPAGIVVDQRRHDEIVATFEGLLLGAVERDGFNRLVVLAGLTAHQADVLRCYAKYAHQTGFTFSQAYVEGTLARLPELAAELVALFEGRFDPDLMDGDRVAAVAHAESRILEVLDAVPSLDDDRIGRTFLALIRATVRTSAYQDTPTIAFKFDPSKVPDLPAPRPAHEIFVCSSRVEGVHLRGGPIARGGLRWSDRPEDYRTEVLGLAKAQMVKNAVIVPDGAKGGFVMKRPPAAPAERRDEVVACYRMFVSGLLDVTDNVVGDDVVPPPRTVRYDGDDPYLVVAADKGTATFSDIANEIAIEHGFWLGDAFASGGSAGYDHKEMGITARGAWESARRHARLLGKNADTDELTVVGIGDMSGDVFGNGMLRSRHLKLIAAFDHRHVFIDPDPDPERSYAERKRLFEMPRSSWAEYDRSVLSDGAIIEPRTVKSIELTPQAREALGVTVSRATPNELISAILRAPVDMLWNGGVGTYVKASTESHEAVGDRANDAVRVDARELRCRMVVEGGNLGVTQLGRVEYALKGGYIHTDAIDNSAGVDCSDHEVNIKILLGEVMREGELTLEQRNRLLAEMTDEVASLVLANNRAQTLALQIARRQGLPMVNVHARYLDLLEAEGFLDRALEFLPSDKQIVERQSTGSGLRTPEFAVMIAYTKNANVAEILRTDLPDDPVLADDVVEYFPTPLRERYRPEILRHRLKREIAATQLMNQMVNLSGISYDHRMTEDTGATVADVARGWLAVREILDFPSWWDDIDDLDHLALEDHMELLLDCRRAAERCSLWFLRNRRPPINISAEVAHFRAPVRSLAAQLHECLRGPIKAAADALVAERIASGVPEDLAARSSVWRLLHTVFDVVETADRLVVAPPVVARAYWSVFDRLELLWLWDAIGALPRSDRWQTQGRSALRDDLLAAVAALAANVVGSDGGSVERWEEINARSVDRTMSMLTEIRRGDTFDITNLTVALRQLRNLALTS
ncbi:MAG TPA: NAD-glutamate dehydrogenase [Ilumatobacter sp.]|nr:NAD-glutamate dehydrogenase [Ilumatobacter sp.]